MQTDTPRSSPAPFVSLEQRSEQDQIFRQLLDAAPDAVVVIDTQGRIVFASSQTERLFGYPRGALLGEAVEILVPDRLKESHESRRRHFSSAPHARPMGSGLELSGRRRDGSEFPIEISLSPVLTPEGTLCSASIRDISQRKDTEASLRQSQAQHEEDLRRAQELAETASSAKSEFLASMSHELRTPLNAVLGFAQLLQRDRKNPLSPRQLERVEHVLQGGEHLLRLIDDVLDLSRIEAGRVLVSLERVSLPEVIAEVKTTLAPLAARARIQLRLEPLAPGASHVVADRTRLKQILMNYGSNAIKYGRADGSATFRARCDQGCVRIAVTDDGIGIARDKQGTLFQPFQRAGQEAGPIEGTGIGLVISKRLAQLMGGTVGFESVEGQGSTFWIELPPPVAQEPAVAIAAAAERSADGGLAGTEGRRYLIVYVEDNPSNIAFMRDLLADFERLELVTTPTAEIGVEIARARRPDVVIMDINLPGMSGIEASRLLKSWPETRDIPILALSAAAMIRDAARVAGAGFYRYLTKPVQVEELTRTLEELLVD